MSGVKNLVAAENKGLKQPTNARLAEEGIAGRDEAETKTKRA